MKIPTKTKSKDIEEIDPKIRAVTCHPEWREAPETIDPKDPFVNGFVSNTVSNGVKKYTPYDYLTDPVSGLRFAGPYGVATKPSGVNVVNLMNGIPTYATLPPIAIWRLGEWLSDIEMDDWPSATDHMSVEELHNAYLTSGEGTNGNYEFRIYKCPSEIGAQLRPKHPLMWPKKLKEYQTPAYGGEAWKSAPATAKPATPAAPTLPAGVRFRCVGCGHWFKESDLKGHNMVCPTKQGGFNDWAIMCDTACGCTTLHQVAECKPGFPRPVVEKEEVEVTAESTPVEAPPAPKDDDDGV